ncbi:MAG: flagellar basal body rod protein FlgB [Opitutales bacterium]
MEAIWDSANYRATRQMLDASMKAHELYAGNLAHVNTAGYQRREVNPAFFEAVRAQLASGSLEGGAMPAAEAVLDRSAAPNSPSGNSVALARELGALQSNSLTYDFLTRSARGRFERLHMAITGRP